MSEATLDARIEALRSQTRNLERRFERVETELYLSGPRWAFSAKVVEREANRIGLHVVDISETKGLLTKAMFITVYGPREKVEMFEKATEMAVLSWAGARLF